MTLTLGHLGKKGERGIEISYYFSVNGDKSGMASKTLEGCKAGTMGVM